MPSMRTHAIKLAGSQSVHSGRVPGRNPEAVQDDPELDKINLYTASAVSTPHTDHVRDQCTKKEGDQSS